MTDPMPTVLFLCVHNAGRSQMAAAILAQRSEGTITIHSAGSAPGETLNPAVVEVLLERLAAIVLTSHRLQVQPSCGAGWRPSPC